MAVMTEVLVPALEDACEHRVRQIRHGLGRARPDGTMLAAVTCGSTTFLAVPSALTGKVHRLTVSSEFDPVLHRDDVAAGKTTALDGRAEVRDAIDVDGLLKAGYTRERLMELANQNDDGFDPRMFADSRARIQRYTDKQFAAYGLDATEAAALRKRFAVWPHQLTAPEDETRAGK